eukprot:gene25263-33792_t
MGVASEGSIPDGYLKDYEMKARGIFEVTHDTDAPAEEGIRQGASAASNVALFQLQYGVRVDDIVIPVIGSNGYLMQFAAVVMLKPSFPMLVMLSPVLLDLTDNTMLLESARLLCCVKILASYPLIPHRNQLELANIPRQLTAMAYCTLEYHEKPLADFFVSTVIRSPNSTQYFHIASASTKKTTSERQRYYFRTFQSTTTKSGFPSYELNARESFLYHCFHRVGVVHLDLYLSNIMWREISDVEVQLKFIDWDAALFRNECPIPEIVQERLQGRRTNVRNNSLAVDIIEKGLLPNRPSAEDELRYFDMSLIHVLEANLHSRLPIETF